MERVNYPLTPAEALLVRWTGRLIALLAGAVLALCGTIAWAAS